MATWFRRALAIVAVGALLPAVALAGDPYHHGQPAYHAYGYGPPAPAVRYHAYSYQPCCCHGYGHDYGYGHDGRYGYGAPGRFSYAGYNYRNAASKALFRY